MSEAPLRQVAAVPAAADAVAAPYRVRRSFRASGRQAAAVALAGGTVLLWSLLVITLHPGPIGDEKSHYPIAAALAQGQDPYLGNLPMPPTYHWLAAGWMRLAGTSLASVRVLNTGIMLVALGFFAAAARARHGDRAGAQALLFAWNPLLLPYAVLAYTEPLSVMLLALALWLHLRRHTAWAAAALLAACAVRQSNIAWIVLFAAWLLADRLDAAPDWRAAGATIRATWRELLRQASPYGLALLVVTALIVSRPTLLLWPNDMNRAGVNPALFFVFGFVVAVVWAPVWLEEARRLWPASIRPRLCRAAPIVLVVAAIGLLAGLYDNRHPWNGYTGFLHDRFAITLLVSSAARAAVAALIVLAMPLLMLRIWNTPRHAALLAVWAVSLLFLAPHALVDPRYLIHPLVLIHFFTRYEAVTARRLCAWSLLLALATCGYTLSFGGPTSGL